MSISVVMPQMGESVAEGTIVRWIKHVGDTVDKDEPLFEISTDKVDAEIPSPEAGVLLEIRAKEGDTVAVNSVVATIGSPAEDAATGAAVAAVPVERAPAEIHRAAPDQSPVGGADDDARGRVSPAVRRLAHEHGIDLDQIAGSGGGGRVTKRDVDAFIESHGGGSSGGAKAEGSSAPAVGRDGPGVRVEKMSVMRRKIAEHMSQSARTSPHVYSAYEVDFSRIASLREAKKAEYETAGMRLTYTAFVAKATVDAIRAFPITNASLDGDDIVYRDSVNLGIAVALDQGLIVPVIHDAERLDLAGFCRAIHDLASRARTKQLRTEDVQGGTFTVTNPGIFGGLFGLPIINQLQAAILAVGSIDKRVVVVDDQMVVRPMCYLTLGYDHRLNAGADGGRFLLDHNQRLQNFDAALV
jgi:pyruvate dehydrogenase E2 component (dihydrolipoamide acetyltransferase)